MTQSNINDALRAFEATEANLARMEKIWSDIRDMIPEGIVFGDSTDGRYDDACRSFADLHKCLPKINGTGMDIDIFELDTIAQMRLDAREVDQIECYVSVENALFAQDRHLKGYRYHLNKARRQLIRNRVLELVDIVDESLRDLARQYQENYEPKNADVEGAAWSTFKEAVAEIDVLLGSSVKRPTRWNYLQRHAGFGMVQDLLDIQKHDWPPIKSAIMDSLYGDTDSIPVGVEDLGELAASKPTGKVVSKLAWDKLSADDFERLIYSLISHTPGYENPEWLTRTNAPDRGRDLSVVRVIQDELGGTTRLRVIIQCKHWLSKSINLPEVVAAREQMKLWTPPQVDVLIFATSGRFATDAIDYIEKNNQGDVRLKIEMWPESHIERLLASRPALIAEFRLR